MSCLRAGSSTLEWRPQTGLLMDGYGSRKEPNQGYHDPLHVRALALDDGSSRALILNADVIGVDLVLTDRVRDAVSRELAVPPDHVMLAATHTHAGPGGVRVGPIPQDEQVRQVLFDSLVQAASEAFSRMEEASLYAGRGEVDTLSLNRRDPSWPMDGAVTILLVSGGNGRVRTVLVNFACHPTVLDQTNLLYSADYPGAVAATVSRALAGADVLFLTGACANVNPVRTEASFDEVRRFGYVLGGEVVRVVGDMLAGERPRRADNIRWDEQIAAPPLSHRLVRPTLGGVREPVRFELKQFRTVEAYTREIKRLTDLVANAPDTLERRRLASELTAVRAEASSAAWAVEHYGPQQIIESEIHLLRLGNGLAVMGFPGELFLEIGQAVKEDAQEEVLVAGYTNDYAGYLNTAASYGYGGYEGGRTLLRETTEERVRAAATRVVQSVKGATRLSG